MVVRTAPNEVVRAKFIITNFSGKNMNEKTRLVPDCKQAKIRMKGRDTLYIKDGFEARIVFTIQVPSMISADQVTIEFSL